MSSALRVGVLGVGRIGALHAHHLGGAIEGATLAAVYDADDTAARRAAPEGVDLPASAEELLTRPDIGAVVVASPTPLHAEQVVTAAENGKAVFCEKPVALDLATTREALAAVRRHGTAFQIGLNRRFDPGFGALARAVRGGRLGRPEMFRSLSSDPAPPPPAYVAASGGLYLDSAIHDLDLARFVMGEVTRVHATGRVLVADHFAAYDDVDTSVITLEFASGALGVIQNTRRTVYGYDLRIEVHGERGKQVAEDPRATKTWRFDEDGIHADHVHYFLDRFRDAYRLELQAFVDDVRAGTAPAPGPDDADAALVLALAARDAQRSGRPVEPREVRDHDATGGTS